MRRSQTVFLHACSVRSRFDAFKARATCLHSTSDGKCATHCIREYAMSKCWYMDSTSVIEIAKARQLAAYCSGLSFDRGMSIFCYIATP